MNNYENIHPAEMTQFDYDLIVGSLIRSVPAFSNELIAKLERLISENSKLKAQILASFDNETKSNETAESIEAKEGTDVAINKETNK